MCKRNYRYQKKIRRKVSLQNKRKTLSRAIKGYNFVGLYGRPKYEEAMKGRENKGKYQNF